MAKATEISVVIPVKNEAGNIDQLIKEIDKSLKLINYEIIYVNDGSIDNTEIELKNNLKKNNRLRVISHKVSQGQSAALRSGVLASTSSLIATLDGDGQNDPSDLKKMVELIKKYKNKLTLIGGVRVNRKDSKPRLWASSFAKYCRFFLLKDKHPDSGCGIKVFHKELFIKLPYFDHMHRFLSALALREGANVLEFDVKHRERVVGISNYTNIGRLLVGIFDVLGVIWLRKRMPNNTSSIEIFK
jgi:dolichol-phosphate mannosyltransferase